MVGAGPLALHPVTVGVIAGLVVGKPIGVWGTTYLLARFTGARLDDELAWRDVLGVALLGGIGFTVSLLIGELAFGYGTTEAADAKIGVLDRFSDRRCAGRGGPGQPQRRLPPDPPRRRPPTKTTTAYPTCTGAPWGLNAISVAYTIGLLEQIRGPADRITLLWRWCAG